MSDKMRYWNHLGKTDPRHTKQFIRAGGFKGTAIKPIWSFQRMTETFGPVGIGWGTMQPTFQTIEADGEVMVYCTVGVWYEGEGNTPFYGVGGDKVLQRTKDGFRTNDEAFKSAYTDAVTNALKLLGVGADVHMGQFDDVKYVREMQAEFAEEVIKEVAEQKAEPTRAPELDWSLNQSSGILIARALDVQQRESKGKDKKPFLAIKVNGKLGEKDVIFCWHQSLFPILTGAKGKIFKAELTFEKSGFVSLGNLLEVDGEKIELEEAQGFDAMAWASLLQETKFIEDFNQKVLPLAKNLEQLTSLKARARALGYIYDADKKQFVDSIPF